MSEEKTEIKSEAVLTAAFRFEFEEKDWKSINRYYQLTVPASVHRKGANVLFQVYDSGGRKVSLGGEYLDPSSGDIHIRIPNSEDNFAGILIVL